MSSCWHSGLLNIQAVFSIYSSTVTGFLVIVENADRNSPLQSSSLMNMSFLTESKGYILVTTTAVTLTITVLSMIVQPCNDLAAIRIGSIWLKLIMENLSWCCSASPRICQFITSFTTDVIFPQIINTTIDIIWIAHYFQQLRNWKNDFLGRKLSEGFVFYFYFFVVWPRQMLATHFVVNIHVSTVEIKWHVYHPKWIWKWKLSGFCLFLCFSLKNKI